MQPAARNEISAGEASPRPLKDEDLRFQRRQWRVERIGWATMTVIIVAALAGFFGDGPLSRVTSMTSDGAIRVRYERFVRFSAPTTLEIHVAPSASGRPIHLRVSANYLSDMTPRSIAPHVSATSLADQDYVFSFNHLPSTVESKVELQLEPKAIGLVEGWVAVNDGTRLFIKQFIYP